jgi:hypothetical protein
LSQKANLIVRYLGDAVNDFGAKFGKILHDSTEEGRSCC